MPILDLNTRLLFTPPAFTLRMPILLTYLSLCTFTVSCFTSHQSPPPSTLYL